MGADVWYGCGVNGTPTPLIWSWIYDAPTRWYGVYVRYTHDLNLGHSSVAIHYDAWSDHIRWYITAKKGTGVQGWGWALFSSVRIER